MKYPVDIHIWPHGLFAYYSKGHHPVSMFKRSMVAQCGIALPDRQQLYQWCYAKYIGGKLTAQRWPSCGAFPVTVWSAGQ